MNRNIAIKVIPHIIDQHAEEAAFLWILRHAAVDEPHYDLKDLAHLDDRVEAHIDGLRIAGEYGWETCRGNLEFKESGEVFAAAVLALESNDADKLNAVYQVVEAVPETVTGMISALGWVHPAELAGKVSGLLASADPLWRRVGIAACAIHRVDPKNHLLAAIQGDDDSLRARALRAVGELGRHDLLPELHKYFQHESLSTRFWSAWSALLMGDNAAKPILLDIASNPSEFQIRALSIIIRVVSDPEVKTLLGSLAKSPDTARVAIMGTGMRGDPAYIPWLIQQMDIPELARVAGEAVSLITGVDIAYHDLEAEDAPEGFTAGPTEDPDDDNVEMDEDEDLAWPEPALVQQWWSEHQSEFQNGQRYLLGRPASVEHCQQALREGKQRQRHAAALELALMQPGSGLFETRAVGKRQQQKLSI